MQLTRMTTVASRPTMPPMAALGRGPALAQMEYYAETKALTNVIPKEVATAKEADLVYIPGRVMAEDVTNIEGRGITCFLTGTKGFMLIRLGIGAVGRIALEVNTVTKSAAVVVRLLVTTAASLPSPRGMGLGR